ncbi:MAG: hypothetical protein JSS66_11915 [Armatimonadetes bacterium]|nr:hypothetical protein [Armatimonadota bacterium]
MFNKQTKLTLGLLGLALTASASATPVRFGSGMPDEATAVAVNQTTGDTYVVGAAYHNAMLHNDLCVVKYNSAGTFMWSRYYGGAGDDSALGVAVNSTSGDIYVTGYSRAVVGGQTESVTLLYNSAGALLANRTWGGALDDAGKKIVLDSIGNVIVAGYTTQAGSAKDFLLLKFSPSLVPTFSAWWGGTYGDDEPAAMAIGPNGAYLAGSMTNSSGNKDGVVVRFSLMTGIALGNRAVTGAVGYDDWLTDVALDAAGSVYVCGTIHSTTYDDDMIVAKCNPTLGIFNWAVPWAATAGYNRDFANKMVLTGTDLYVGGASFGITGLAADAVVVDFDPATGALRPVPIWTYNFMDHDEVRDLCLDAAGNLYAMLYTDGMYGHDYGVARINGGTTTWVSRYNYSNHDEAADMALDLSGAPVVTGRSEGVGTGFDWATGKYDPTTGADLW